jgi:branched-chain amino acid transport system substrate-binding protein
MRGMKLAAMDNPDVKIHFEDNQADPKASVSAIMKLISQNKPNVILGGMFSNTTLAIKPVAINNDIILITPTGASEEIPLAEKGIFSIYPSAMSEGAYMAKHLNSNYSFKSILIVNENQDVYKRIAEGFSKTLISEFVVEEFSTNQSNYRDLISKMRSRNFEAIFMAGNKDDLVKFIRTCKEMNFNLPVFSQSTLFDKEIVDRFPEVLNGVKLTAPFFDIDDESNSSLKSFVEKFKANYNVYPDVWAAYGYDSVDLVKKTWDKDKETMIKNLISVKDEIMLTGAISFEKNGSAVRSFTIYSIEKGEFTKVK